MSRHAPEDKRINIKLGNGTIVTIVPLRCAGCAADWYMPLADGVDWRPNFCPGCGDCTKPPHSRVWR